MYLNILVILNALMKVVDAPKSTFSRMEIILDIMETTTIMKSKQLPTSLKYTLNPKAMILKVASHANTTAKL